MPRRDADHMNAQRERILRATIECISQKGVEGTSISNICKQAGLSTGALYIHFANKEDIIAEALRYGTLRPLDLPGDWQAFKAMVTNLEPQMGFDIATVVRTRLHLHAESVHPGRLHDTYKPLLLQALSVLADHLQALSDAGNVRLKMSAWQTALSISAFIDGMLWIALASDRPLDELSPELAAGLDCFVEPDVSN